MINTSQRWIKSSYHLRLSLMIPASFIKSPWFSIKDNEISLEAKFTQVTQQSREGKLSMMLRMYNNYLTGKYKYRWASLTKESLLKSVMRMWWICSLNLTIWILQHQLTLLFYQIIDSCYEKILKVHLKFQILHRTSIQNELQN